VSIEVTVSDIGDFLKGINAHMISCFEAKTKSTKSKAFQVCIDRLDRQAFLDTMNWPKSVILRPWTFKASSKQSDAAAPPDAGGQYMDTASSVAATVPPQTDIASTLPLIESSSSDIISRPRDGVV